ncbi:MAG: HD domain-containing phosphohydrolase [Pseudomonadota bacterium]
MNTDTASNTTILIVDDEDSIRRLLHRLIRHNGYTCFLASNGKEALAVLNSQAVDVVITDIAMPEMDGIELTRRIKENFDSDVIMMTGYIKDLSYGDAIATGASDFVQKPFDSEEFQIRLKRVIRERSIHAELKESLNQVREVLDGVIHSLSSTVEARDPYTSGHQKRVSAIAVSIAECMGLPEYQISGIRMAGLIHDIGKIAIPAEILSKPGRLSDIEFKLIQNHAQVGYEILKDIRFPMPIADMVHQHHERIDGSGYPQGLKGDEILLESKIIAVADVVEAMSSHRPYRPTLGISVALEEIKLYGGTRYNPDVVAACLKTVTEKGL